VLDLSTLTWFHIPCLAKTEEERPCPRVGHRAILLNDQLWVYGGTFVDDIGTYHYLDDLYVLDMNSNHFSWTWRKVHIKNQGPVGRHSPIFIQHPLNKNQFILYGGNNSVNEPEGDLDDFFIFDTLSLTWKTIYCYSDHNSQQVSLPNPDDIDKDNQQKEIRPKPRWCATGDLLGASSLVLLGGYSINKDHQMNEIWVMDLYQYKWFLPKVRRRKVQLHTLETKKIEDKSTKTQEMLQNHKLKCFYPSSGVFHTSCHYEDKIIVYGGTAKNLPNKLYMLYPCHSCPSFE